MNNKYYSKVTFDEWEDLYNKIYDYNTVEWNRKELDEFWRRYGNRVSKKEMRFQEKSTNYKITIDMTPQAISTHLTIYKLKDEWYVVTIWRFGCWKSTHKCDQISGLMRFLDDKLNQYEIQC